MWPLMSKIPYRIDLAGGWLDQPFVSRHYSGSVITFPIEPNREFNKRSGLATSTRDRAIELWGDKISKGDHAKLAKILFCYENPPGKVEIAGSQDAIGIVVPGITNSSYNGEYWPHQIETIEDKKIVNFLENHISLLPLTPRHGDFRVLEKTKITKNGAKKSEGNRGFPTRKKNFKESDSHNTKKSL